MVVSEVRVNSNSSNSALELGMASIPVCPRMCSSPAVLCSRVRPPVTALLVPTSLPESEQFGSLGMFLGQPSGREQDQELWAFCSQIAAVVSALSESLLSLRFMLWPFSEQGWTPGSHHHSQSREDL